MKRTTTRTVVTRLAAVVVTVAALAGAVWHAISKWVPDQTIARLPGATETEVRAMLGEPDIGSDEDRWLFRRPTRFAEFRVDFSKDRRVTDWSYDY
jgi:hypothetical protein